MNNLKDTIIDHVYWVDSEGQGSLDMGEIEYRSESELESELKDIADELLRECADDEDASDINAGTLMVGARTIPVSKVL